jgi:two-component system, cell cycle sensor histidine kinase and response regulator CckA
METTVTIAFAELEYARARSSLRAIEDRLMRQRDALLQLTALQVVDCDALPAAFASILEASAAALSVARASIWRYDEHRTAIECADLYEGEDGRHVSGARLLEMDFPNYFRALAESDIVAVEDAERDPRTAEFTESYLRPLAIRSMLDAPLHLKGKVIGVLCFESVDEPRQWTTDEKAFAIAVSNLVSLAFERCERSRAESTLKLQAAALDAAAHAMVITTKDATIVWANRAFATLSGYSIDAVIGRRLDQMMGSMVDGHPVGEAIWDTLLGGKVWQGEVTNRRADGTLCTVDQTITPVRDAAGAITHFVAIKRDLTDQRALEAQFLQAQKMEVVGRLAGGIAHDFNNMLTVINGMSELALEELPRAHPLRHDLERILESGQRAASLTRQLLTFSRKQIVSRRPHAVAGAIGDFRGMLQRLIGEDIRLEAAVAPGTGSILADLSQFEQVLLNLAVNAKDAMPRGGSLKLSAEPRDVAEPPAGAIPPLRPGKYVALRIADSGTGMSAHVRERIFEPFFTTKEEGKGTGLGMATVYAIVEQAGGSIAVDSELGVGTTFTVYWPRVADDGAGTRAECADVRPSGAETILIVEDDEGVRELCRRSLAAAGYAVLAAPDASAATKILSEYTGEIALLVTDVVLPGAGGRELAAVAKAERPRLRVLFASGYTDDTILAHGVRQNTVQFLPKPYSPRALAIKVREVLDLPAR